MLHAHCCHRPSCSGRQPLLCLAPRRAPSSRYAPTAQIDAKLRDNRPRRPVAAALSALHSKGLAAYGPGERLACPRALRERPRDSALHFTLLGSLDGSGALHSLPPSSPASLSAQMTSGQALAAGLSATSRGGGKLGGRGRGVASFCTKHCASSTRSCATGGRRDDPRCNTAHSAHLQASQRHVTSDLPDILYAVVTEESPCTTSGVVSRRSHPIQTRSPHTEPCLLATVCAPQNRCEAV